MSKRATENVIKWKLRIDRQTDSLKVDIISKKSSNVISPSLDEEKTLQILSLNGLT